MLLSELTLPIAYDGCKDLAMVYSYEVAVAMYGIQQEHGDHRHVAVGLPLTDGRWMMLGEVLSAVRPNGILAWAAEYLTPEIMAQIEVVPLSEAVALLPQEDTWPT